MIAIHLEQQASRIQHRFSPVGTHHCGSEGKCAQLKDVGVTEHFVERPCVRWNYFVRAGPTARVCPFVTSDGDRFCPESRDELEVPGSVRTSPHLGAGSRPTRSALPRVDQHFLLQLHSVCCVPVIIMLAEHVNVAQAMGERFPLQSAAEDNREHTAR